jgi:hypothetical protein
MDISKKKLNLFIFVGFLVTWVSKASLATHDIPISSINQPAKEINFVKGKQNQ